MIDFYEIHLEHLSTFSVDLNDKLCSCELYALKIYVIDVRLIGL